MIALALTLTLALFPHSHSHIFSAFIKKSRLISETAFYFTLWYLNLDESEEY